MARPRELFNTPAPQAMSQMGQGIADAYANVGRIEGQGMQALGQGIAQGITSAASSIAGAYGDYKKMQSQVKADAAAFNSFKDYLPAEFVNQQQTLENDPKASLMDKQQFYQSAKGYLGAAIGQKYKMDQIGAEQAGIFNRAMAAREVAPDFSNLGQGLKASYGEAPAQPPTMAPQEMGFDATSAATKLQDYMIRKYGSDYKTKGIKASSQDVMDAGL
jgi:hypothetical protein